MTKDDFIKIYLDLFNARRDAYAIRLVYDFDEESAARVLYPPSTYSLVVDDGPNYTTQQVRKVVSDIGTQEYGYRAVEAHLTGEHFLGVYPIHPDSTVRFFALDFDAHGPEGAVRTKDEVWQDAYRHYKILKEEAGLPVYIEVSRSGNGFHIWGFLEEPVYAGVVRHALRQYIEKSEIFDRMFPNQDSVNEGRPLGNLIALPLFGPFVKEGRGTFFEVGKDGELIRIEDQKSYLAGFIEKISKKKIEHLFDNSPETYIPETQQIFRNKDVEGLAGGYKVVDERFGCEWVRWTWKHPDEVTEPEWYALACQFAQLEGGRALFHEFSKRDPSRYNPKQADLKFNHAVRQNKPHTCGYIRENLSGPKCYCDEKFAEFGVNHPYDLAKIPLFALAQSVSEAHKVSTPDDDIDEVLDWMKEIHKDPSMGMGIPWGWKSLDEITGFMESTLNIIAARPAIGKAQPLDAKVLTPAGFQKMGDLQLGDQVIGGDGQPTTIRGIFPQGKRRIYKVVFEDGTSTEACDEHLFLTTTRKDRKAGRVGTVKELAEIRRTLRVNEDQRVNHQIPFVKPVEFPTKKLPLDPYLLGVILGDGDTGQLSIRIHNIDYDILTEAEKCLPEGDSFSACDGVSWRIVRREKSKAVSVTRKALEEMGLTGKTAEYEFIPQEYLLSSTKDRIALFQGLMDSDGSVTNGSTLEYCTSSERLKDGVVFLARSLGARANVNQRYPHYTYKSKTLTGQLSFRITISFPEGENFTFFRSSRKQEMYSPRKRLHSKGIVDVIEVGIKDAQCILVDNADHLYVTDDFNVTHNTALTIDLARKIAWERKTPVVYFSLEMSRKQLLTRLICNIAQVDSKRMRQGKLSYKEWRRLEQARAKIKKEYFPLFIDDTTRDIRKMMDIAGDIFFRYGKGIVFIDYLQLAEWLQTENSEYQAVTRMSKESKLTAKVLVAPVVALCQLNRGGEDASPDGPTLDSWLRSSGQIEQDADTICFMLGERGQGVKERTLAFHKQRDLESNVRATLEYNQPMQRFEERGTWLKGPVGMAGSNGAPTVAPPTTKTEAPDLFRGL
jgi:replicative DNA helicase